MATSTCVFVPLGGVVSVFVVRGAADGIVTVRMGFGLERWIGFNSKI